LELEFNFKIFNFKIHEIMHEYEIMIHVTENC